MKNADLDYELPHLGTPPTQFVLALCDIKTEVDLVLNGLLSIRLQPNIYRLPLSYFVTLSPCYHVCFYYHLSPKEWGFANLSTKKRFNRCGAYNIQ